jgi:hypothetical protein
MCCAAVVKTVPCPYSIECFRICNIFRPLHLNCYLFQISEDVLDAEAEEMDEEPITEGKDDEEEPSPPEPDG